MSHLISRRALLAQIAVAGGAALVAPARMLAQSKPSIVVYKDPLCGCCTKWVEHMVASGFVASVTDTNMMAIRLRYQIGERLQSCHTGIVGGYVIEGHVPASDVKKLLAAKPKGVKGLAIPGMPASAPGMDLLPFQPYTVLAFDEQGKTTVFARHDKP
jgi:hypothetical protein